jgi:hypothetical protein
MAEKLRQARVKACSKPLTLKWFRRSHSLALLKTFSMHTRFLNRFSAVLPYRFPKSSRVVLGVSHNDFEDYASALQLFQQRFKA